MLAGALRAQKAEAFHFCGHIYTTGSCPHPVGLPRIDRNGFPLRAVDGKPIGQLSAVFFPGGKVLLDPAGKPGGDLASGPTNVPSKPQGEAYK